MENMTAPTFTGYDGEGYMESGPEMGNIDYDRTTPGAEDFMNSITYSVDKTENLSNGDEVTITAIKMISCCMKQSFNWEKRFD